jgi:predicted peptidase
MIPRLVPASLSAALLLALPHAQAQQERIPPPTTPPHTLSPDEAASLRPAFEHATLPTPTGPGLPYRLLRPQQPTPPPAPAKLYPLVIMLHGSGQTGSDNEAQLNNLALAWAQPAIQQQYPAFVAVPQFPDRTANYTPSTENKDHLLASHAGAPLLPLFELVDHLTQTLPIDPDRVYLVGFSMGASAAWQSLLLHPDKFAAAILLAGIPPERSLAPRFRQIPLLICHGDADPENPYAPDLAMFQALSPKSKARFRTYTGMLHTPPPDILDPTSTWWRDWLLTQHR